ncbi:CotS family spore coat protein [Cohnella faecalis]|uniref:CotS family spore coat protein n=1 Tax=Cohnella faecalis TaxID=2315694 RepID=A0A398CKW6_9BACL|nr:CotS family spore coat protein [Cohnella faecalis]RIE01859.1 CotS family spore coat protein [Cohnella faecalis]
MEPYIVQPWDHLTAAELPGIVLEQYVPPELEAMAYEVMELYDMRVSEMTLITSKPDKGGAIWKIVTNHGPRSIKVLHREPSRSLFSIGAQQYLVEQGARVPQLIPTVEGALYVEAGGKLWIVTDWIEPLIPVSKVDVEGAASLCNGLGEFHRISKGYVPPPNAGKSSRLYGWKKNYEKIIAKIGWFRHIAEAYPETAASARLLSVVDEFERQALDIFARFQESPYGRMKAMGEPYWGLAHQDYGWSNGQMGPDGIWIIDLDGVAYDLPFRDLRKLITSTMDDMGVWDLTWVRGMIDGYHQANPIDQEMFELLWIDMAFPNEFYKHVKEVVFDPVTFMNLELDPILQRVMLTEASKWEALTQLEADKIKYEPGDYTAPEPVVDSPFAVMEFTVEGAPLAAFAASAPAMDPVLAPAVFEPPLVPAAAAAAAADPAAVPPAAVPLVRLVSQAPPARTPAAAASVRTPAAVGAENDPPAQPRRRRKAARKRKRSKSVKTAPSRLKRKSTRRKSATPLVAVRKRKKSSRSSRRPASANARSKRSRTTRRVRAQ